MDHFTTFSQLLGIKMTKYILKLISHCPLIYMKKEDKKNVPQKITNFDCNRSQCNNSSQRITIDGNNKLRIKRHKHMFIYQVWHSEFENMQSTTRFFWFIAGSLKLGVIMSILYFRFFLTFLVEPYTSKVTKDLMDGDRSCCSQFVHYTTIIQIISGGLEFELMLRYI